MRLDSSYIIQGVPGGSLRKTLCINRWTRRKTLVHRWMGIKVTKEALCPDGPGKHTQLCRQEAPPLHHHPPARDAAAAAARS
jgi:hypothetical protein